MIGIDIVSIKRIKKILNNRFLEKIFTENEIKYFNENKNNIQIIAGHFSAKEAVMKVFENCKKIAFKDIEIYHNENGKPFVKLFNIAEQEFTQKKYKQINISISHEIDYACAVCELI